MNRLPLVALPLGAILLTVSGVAFWLGERTRYYPFLNDFWPLLFQADRLDWSNADSFRNGFFPPGYAVFLTLIGGKFVLTSAYVWNVAFACATLVLTHLFATRLGAWYAGIIAAALLAFYPLNFSLMMTTGPDSGCVLMLWLAVYFMLLSVVHTDSRTGTAAGWAAGALFLLAILWRYHALVFALSSLIAFAVAFQGRLLWRTAAGVALALVVLAALSLLPGFSEQLSRAQAFGVWEAFHPVNWYQMPTNVPPTVGGVIRENPAAFLDAYLRFHRPYFWLIVPPLIAAIVLRGTARRGATALLILECVYLPLVGVGTSPRGIAPIVPASMTCVGLVAAWVVTRLSSPRSQPLVATAVIAMTLTIAGRAWWPDNRAFAESSIQGFEWRRAVETELRAQGVTAPLQVFGDAGFHFVLKPGPGWYSYLARSNGGWPRLDLYDLHTVAPELRTDSLDAFIDDCARSGITHVVLGATAGGLVPDLGRVFGGQLQHPRLRQTGSAAGFNIFTLAH